MKVLKPQRCCLWGKQLEEAVPGRHETELTLILHIFPEKSPLSEQFTRVLSEIKNTYAENRLVVAKREEGSRGGMNWTSRVSRCKLLHIRWISNQVLLYSTGYTQYPVIKHKGKE